MSPPGVEDGQPTVVCMNLTQRRNEKVTQSDLLPQDGEFLTKVLVQVGIRHQMTTLRSFSDAKEGLNIIARGKSLRRKV